MKKLFTFAIFLQLFFACLNGVMGKIDIANSCLLMAILFTLLRGQE